MMKKLLMLLACLLAVLSWTATAEVDLSGMSTEDLTKLRAEIADELRRRSDEANPVTVPVGIWKVGEDIPFGYWTITASDDAEYGWASITYCKALDVTGHKPLLHEGFYFATQVKAPGSNASVDTDRLDLDLQEEGYIIVEYGPVIFKPFTGKPDLGF